MKNPIEQRRDDALAAALAASSCFELELKNFGDFARIQYPDFDAFNAAKARFLDAVQNHRQANYDFWDAQIAYILFYNRQGTAAYEDALRKQKNLAQARAKNEDVNILLI